MRQGLYLAPCAPVRDAESYATKDSQTASFFELQHSARELVATSENKCYSLKTLQMAVFAQQKEFICGVIRSGTCTADLYSLIDSIDHSDLQSLFLDFVSGQTSPEKVVKMYHATNPLPNAIGDDCMRHMMEYLTPRELASMSCLCRRTKEMCSAINSSDSRFDNLLLRSPVFEEYFKKKPRGKSRIGYFLQNKYNVDDLNNYSFKKLGRKGMLVGDDKEVYDICNHFGFNCKLLAWSQSRGIDHCSEEQPFADCTTSDYW